MIYIFIGGVFSVFLLTRALTIVRFAGVAVLVCILYLTFAFYGTAIACLVSGLIVGIATVINHLPKPRVASVPDDASGNVSERNQWK